MKTAISIIDASAGTGKTYTLTERIYKSIQSNTVTPDGLLLTTFTKKAAQELKDRVASKLIETGQRKAAHLIRQSIMGTVNSVCDSLIRENAFNLGCAVKQNVIDEMQSKLLFKQALSLSLTESISQTMDDYSYRFKIKDHISGRDWKDQVKMVVDSAESNNISSDKFAASAEASIRMLFEGINPVIGQIDNFKALLNSALKVLRSAQEVKFQKNTKGAIDSLENALQQLEKPSEIVWYDILAVTKIAPAKELISSMDKLIEAANNHYIWKEFHDDISGYIRLLFDVAAAALGKYKELKGEGTFIDFSDQELLWLKALEDKEVANKLQERAKELYVDEFQDTSPIQLAIFLKMNEIIGKSVWVGDPKQSIFAFRGADPVLMRMVQTSMPLNNEEPLKRNWRSRPKLVEFFNSVFKKPFTDNGISYPDMDSARKDDLSNFWLENWMLRLNSASANPKKSVANGILSVLTNPDEYPVLDKKSNTMRPIRAEDIAILAPTNNNCAEIAAALDEACIPNDIGTAGLLLMNEIVLIKAALALMHDTYDSLAAAQIIWFTDVLNSSNTDDIETKRANWFDSILQKNSENEKQLFKHPAVEKIIQHANHIKSMPLTDSIRFAAEISGAYRINGVRTKSSRSVLNHIEQLINLAEKYTAQQQTESKWADYFGMKLFFEALEDEELDLTITGGGNAVRISTWHRSKGLEWPMVILYGLNKEEKENRIFNTRVITDGTFSADNPLANRLIVAWPYPYDNKSICQSFISAVKQNSEGSRYTSEIEAEQLRLMYVAFTRARDYLVFTCNRFVSTKNEEKKYPYHKLSQLIDKGHLTIPKTGGNGWRVKSFDENLLQTGTPPEQLWFEASERNTQNPPLYLSPSSIKDTAKHTVGELIKFSDSIPVEGKLDPISLGEAFHAYMAVDTSKMSHEQKVEVADRLLLGWGVAENVKGADLVKQAAAFETFIAAKWKNCVWQRELPMQLFENGHIIRGRTDLIIEVGEDFAVFDYKTVQDTETDKLIVKAESYAPQLDAYRRTAIKAGKKKCLGMYLVFPVLGQVVEVC
ncbi:MAG: UvrD-helicase domain-containing protein [Fibrobacteres bacterium]|nr:UvrD-helicase domain-containing protein [Fibrobacterota bacterium]